ncbi:DOG1-like protein 4 [Tanacetum coccineum]
MTHYHDYFLAKAQISSQNVFLVLSPPWFCSYERTFLWLSGFKPGLAINVVKRCGVQLNTNQSDRMDRLMAEIKREEGKITERRAWLEQQMVAPPMLALARMGGREVNGMTDNMGDRDANNEPIREILGRCRSASVKDQKVGPAARCKGAWLDNLS